MGDYLDQRDTDYVRENLVFNYLLGNEQELLLKSYVQNNRIELRFDPDCFYFFMTGRHKKFVNPYTPETFYSGVSAVYRIYDRMRAILLENGWDGNVFLIKEDNSKQTGVLFSPRCEGAAAPQDMAQKLYDGYLEIVPSLENVSTSFVGPYTGYEQIHPAFLDARALNDLLFFGIRDCIITKELRRRTAKPCDITAILANVRALIHTVCCGTLKKACSQADYLVDSLVAPSYLMTNYYALCVAMDDLLGMLEIVYPDHIRIERFPAQHFHTLSEYKAYLRKTLETVFAQLHGVHRYPPTILLALSFINRNYAHQLSLAELSEYVYANPSSLSSEFNAELGITLSEYIAALRLCHAKRLLRESDLSVAEIAGQSGFTSAKYFREVFKKQTGLSPQQYRTQINK